MKNLKIAVFCLICSVVLTTSCNKTTENPDVKSGDEDYTELIEKSKAMQEHVEAFKEKMEYYRDNAGVKSGGQLYSADEAVTELESLLNYNFCYTGIECNKKSFVTSEVLMPLDDIQRINDPELMIVYYDKVIDTIQAQMNRVNYCNMKLLLVDIEVAQYDSNGDAVISIGALIGNETTSILQNDAWIFGKNEGLCVTGWYNDEDAATQLCTRVTNSMYVDPPSGYIWTFGDPHDQTISPLDHPLWTASTHNNYLDYKIFYAEDAFYTPNTTLIIGDDEECLSAYEMSFYEAHYISFAEEVEDNYSQDFSYCLNDGNEYNVGNHHYIQHDYTIYVGTKLLKYPFTVDDILEY